MDEIIALEQKWRCPACCQRMGKSYRPDLVWPSLVKILVKCVGFDLLVNRPRELHPAGEKLFQFRLKVPAGALWRRNGSRLLAVKRLPQAVPCFLFLRSATSGCADPQIALDLLVQIVNGQRCHGALL